MTDEERDEAGIENLPKNLYEAIQEMRKSDFVKGVLGKEVFKKYIKAKEEEWMEYTSQVTDWEIDRYLGRIYESLRLNKIRRKNIVRNNSSIS